MEPMINWDHFVKSLEVAVILVRPSCLVYRPGLTGLSSNSDNLEPISKMTLFLVNSPKNLLESLHLIGQKIQSSSGVMVNFERLPESPSNGRPELGNSNEPKPWHNTTGMVNVRQNYKTRNFQGYWPIPESFWADPNEPKCPPRYATPTLKFSSKGDSSFFSRFSDNDDYSKSQIYRTVE